MALVWQSSIFWIAICTALFVLVGCTVYNMRSQPAIATLMPSNNQPITRSTPHPPDFFYPSLLNQVAIPPDMLYIEQSGALPGTNQVLDNRIMRVDAPICYLATQETSVCMGRIWNESDSSVGDTAVNVSLQAQNADVLLSNTFLTPQRRLEPDNFVPYHTIFSLSAGGTESDFELNFAEFTATAELTTLLDPKPDTQVLSVQESRGILTPNGRYNLTATILNDTSYAIKNLRLVITLDDIEWGIVGYRVHEVGEALEMGAEKSIQLSIIPYRLPDRIAHHIHVEGETIRD